MSILWHRLNLKASQVLKPKLGMEHINVSHANETIQAQMASSLQTQIYHEHKSNPTNTGKIKMQGPNMST